MASTAERGSTIWCRCLAPSSGALPDEVRHRLSEVGIEIGAEAKQPSGGPGLLWLGEASDLAVDALRELNSDGLRQILVIAPHRRSVGNRLVWRLVAAGAADVIAWDGTPETAGVIAARLQRWMAIDELLAAAPVRQRLVGRSPAWISMLRQLVEVAAFTDASILLVGESGVGKEEAARLIHALDLRRRQRELVVVDCTTVVAELSGSEFFGHERGAFTGATASRDGAFALADGGTLFLDEVGELAPRLQAQLLRVVQERTFKPVGANLWSRTDFRLVCATNRDLVDEVAQGRFRRDLYHRIAAWSCRLPPLRQRADDILPLALHFLRETLPAGVEPQLDPAVEELLQRRDYPGNARDLRQLMLRIGKRHVGPGPITVGDVPADELSEASDLGRWPDATLDEVIARALSAGVGLRDIGRAATEAAIRLALRDADGNLQRAALRLGVTDRALQIRRANRSEGAG